MNHTEHCDALEEEIGRFADLVTSGSATDAVPSCPGWTAADLALHLGTVHRWAEHLVRVRAPARIPSAEMGLDTGPRHWSSCAAWIRRGGTELLATLRGADPADGMWAWGVDQHVGYWSRRQLHETLVHRIDLDLAARRDPEVAPAIAADAIDEFLDNLAAAAPFSPNVNELRGKGERLVVSCDDTGCHWSILLTPDGFDVEAGGATAGNARLSGPASAVLLVLYRRRPARDAEVVIDGDAGLVEFWLDHSALE